MQNRNRVFNSFRSREKAYLSVAWRLGLDVESCVITSVKLRKDDLQLSLFDKWEKNMLLLFKNKEIKKSREVIYL